MIQRKPITLRELLQRINAVAEQEPGILDQPLKIDSLDQPAVSDVGWSGSPSTLFLILAVG